LHVATPIIAPQTAQPSVLSPQPSPLHCATDTFDDQDTGEPTQYGRFSRNWDEEEALDVLLDELDAGRLSDKQALMRARKREAKFPDNLEIQNFIANRLWALALRDEAAEVYERAFTPALTVVPKGYKGQIAGGEIDNRSFLRVKHGTLLGLMHRREGKSAMVLAEKLLAGCPMDNRAYACCSATSAGLRATRTPQ
jgi:hypothetical protein